MAYTVNFRGHQVICDTPDDVVRLVSLNSSDGSLNRSVRPIRSVVGSLPSDQKAALELLDKAWPDAVTDEQIRDDMNLSGNKKLAGVLAGISKAAKRAKIPPMIHHDVVRTGKGTRVHRYSLSEAVHAALHESK